MNELKASRHEGTEARRANARCAPRGFSLIEVLLGIFILGIGIISIASLFPAGIVQQRQSVDDMIGPTVANNAITVLRSKVKAWHFGSLVPSDSYTTNGDWGWSRPAFYYAVNTPVTTANFGVVNVPAGSISIFTEASAGSVSEVPWSEGEFGTNPPPDPFIVTQRERYYPQGTELANTTDAARPQYVWDCMFRRYEGRIQAAIFVYRVTSPGQTARPWAVPGGTSTVPRLPIWLDLTDATQMQFHFNGPWDDGGIDGDVLTAGDNAFVLGTQGGTPYDETDERQAWQESGQWLLDQMGTIHRTLGHVTQDLSVSGHEEVELVRAVPPMPDTAVNYRPASAVISGEYIVGDVVSSIWYLPVEMDSNGDNIPDVRITPVYVTVRDL